MRNVLAKEPSLSTKEAEPVENLRQRAHRLIPAGAHTYSKADDQFPANAPPFIARGKGAVVWDTEGNEYVDWGMGLRSVVLGHAYPPVLDAVRKQLELGSNFVRPSPIESELAEILVSLLPGADMAKFAKDGSDTTSAAVRLARAHTGRDIVAVCRDNPFYSFNDWFIGTSVTNSGVPEAVCRMTLAFSYGNLDELERLFLEYPGEIGCVMIEPAAMAPPTAGCVSCDCGDKCRGYGGCDCGNSCSGGDSRIEKLNRRNTTFLNGAREIAHRHGALMVFDEMITGFRWDVPGAQTLYGVQPDLSCFGKALGNGFSLAALVGRREIMELGGIHHTDRPKVFLLSATHGGETHAIAAALATIQEMTEKSVIHHLWQLGAKLQDALNEASAEAGALDHFCCSGYPCSPALDFIGVDGKPSAEFRTLFLQEMVAQGILMPYLAPSYAHTEAQVERTAEATYVALRICLRGFEDGFDRFLLGPAVKPVFRKFN